MFHNRYKTFILPALLSSIILALFIIGLNSSWLFITDDAYITLRYAQHFAEGYGIVWNISEPPLEGYSNFSYLLLSSALYYVHFSTAQVIDFIRYFSLFSFILVGLMIYRTMRHWVSPCIALLPIILALSYPGFMFWSVSGLETPFYTLLIISAVYCLLVFRYATAGILLAIAGLTRPEAPLFFLIFLAILSYPLFTKQAQSQRPLFSALLKYIGAFSILYLPYFFFRLHYFGHVFPNSVYCKFLNNPHPFSLVWHYFMLAMPLFILSVPAWLMKKPTLFLYYSILPAIACFFLLYGVDPVMGAFNRYALPFILLLMMTSVLGINQLIQHYPVKMKTELHTIALTLLFSLCIYTQLSFHTIHKVAMMYHQKNAMRIQLSQWINQQLEDNSASIASITLGDCGIIPATLNKVDFIDTLCLNSKEMTSQTIHQSYPKFIDWVFNEKKPSYIILASYDWSTMNIFHFTFEQLIHQDARFKKSYHWVKSFTAPRAYNHTYAIYEKNSGEKDVTTTSS